MFKYNNAINIYKFTSYLAEIILRLHYRNQLVNLVSVNKPCIKMTRNTEKHCVGKIQSFITLALFLRRLIKTNEYNEQGNDDSYEFRLYEFSQCGQPVSWPGFEPQISQIQVRNHTV